MNWNEKIDKDIGEIKQRTARLEEKVDNIGSKIDQHIEVDSKRLTQVEQWMIEQKAINSYQQRLWDKKWVKASIVIAIIGALAGVLAVI